MEMHAAACGDFHQSAMLPSPLQPIMDAALAA